MNRQRKILFVSTAIAVLVLLWLLWPHRLPLAVQQETGQRSNAPVAEELPQNIRPQPKSESVSPAQEGQDIQAQAEDFKRAMTNEALLWRTPLLYFGQVVDESNNPIAGVRVSFNTSSVNESLTKEQYDTGTVTTDARGIFKIDGVRGVGMVFELSHPDYYPYPDNVTGFDIRSRPRNGVMPNSEATPMLFRMHHKGNPVALIERRGGLHKPADGTLMEFPLRGKTRNEIIGQLQVQGWKGEPDPQNNGHYDWKVKITLPAGGVLESTNYFDFVAPESGYQQTLEISMPKDDPNWQTNTRRKCFFKLSGYFVRGQIYMDLYHDLFFSMDYFVNPNGSANLENDSQPVINP